MSAVAYDVRSDERTPWGATIWAVFRGYFYTLVLVGLPLALLSHLGLPPLPKRAEEPGPWAPHGAWSVAADVAAYVLVVLVTSWFIHGAVTERFRRPVSPLIVVAAVAATSYAPFLNARLIESALLALFVTAATIRYLAVDRTHTLRLGRPGLAAAAVVVAGGLVTAGSYAFAHPLSIATTGSGISDIGGEGVEYTWAELRNGGHGDLRVVGVVADARVSIDWPPGPRGPVGTVVRGRDAVSISFPRAACPLDVVVRYKLGGREFEQRLVVAHYC